MTSSLSQTPASPPQPEHGRPTVVLGGGPAGLTAGYLLAKRDLPVIVLEAEDQVGGLAKTVVRDGYRFDLGGHRFFTKAKEVERLWHEVMGDEFLLRPRMSRIYWNGKFLDYPLRGTDVMRKLGPAELARVFASYVAAAVRPKGHEETYEEWVSNRFGRRLFELFFRDYTEKVWGVPTSELRAEWAAQRIKGLSFVSAAKAAFFGNKGNKVKSLIQQFHYPRYGPGQMWETMTDEIRALGGEVPHVHAGRAADRRGRHASARSSPAASASSRGTSSPRSRSGRRSRSASLTRLPRCSRPRPACATATSSRSRSSSTARTSSRTTGSTSTTRASASAASRTTAPGARGWSRTRRRPASGSSTSASPATTSGR